MRIIGMLSAIASLGMGVVAASFEPNFSFPNQTGSGRRTYYRNMIGVPSGINRPTGKPHEHKRAIARRLRQFANQEQPQ